jgi:hypothetical protein
MLLLAKLPDFLANMDFTTILMILTALVVPFPKLATIVNVLKKLVPNPNPDPAPVPGPTPGPVVPANPTLDALMLLLKLFIERRDQKGKEAALVALESYQAAEAPVAK